MTRLITDPNIGKPDETYQMLIDAHNGLSDEESMRLNAKLILLLVNHIGDLTVLKDAIATAQKT